MFVGTNYDSLRVSIKKSRQRFYSTFESAIKTLIPGDVVCILDDVFNGINISNFDGGSEGLVIRPINDIQSRLTLSYVHGASIYINKSNNVTLKNFDVSGGLYGIYVVGSSNISLVDNNIHDIGQEGIVIKSEESAYSSSNVVITGNIIERTGKVNSQYGEGIYLGDALHGHKKAIIYNITVENNLIDSTGNEAIDVKANVHGVAILNNIIKNVNLHFNGAITISTSSDKGNNLDVTVKGNSIVGVNNVNGYRPVGIAIGHGNAIIENNYINESDPKFVGICIYSTFVNQTYNTVKVGENTFITNGADIVNNCSDGGTGLKKGATLVFNEFN